MRTNSLNFLLLLLCFVSSMLTQTITWQPLNGPHGGTALSFASNSNGDIFCGSDNNQKGVYRSTDGGLLWQRASSGIELTDRSVGWLVIDDSSHLIAGTGSHIGDRIYKSTDNGNSWVFITNLGGSSCAVNDSGHIYVGDTGYAQYSVSKDGGYTWTHYSHPSPFINCMAINDSGHIFVGGNYTGYRSTDNGSTWNTLALPDGITSFAFSPSGSIFAGCSRESAANSGIYRSTDNGTNWTPVKTGIRINASNNIIISSTGEIIAGSWGWGIWKSVDNGDTWTQYNSGLGHLYVRSLNMSNSGEIYAGLSGGGIYRSTDYGESWTQVGLAVAALKRIAIHPMNQNLFAAVQGVSRSDDFGQTWLPVNSGLYNLDVRTVVFRADSTILIGCGASGYNPPPTVFRSMDNGNSWVRADSGLQVRTVDAMVVDAQGNIYAANYDGVYKSTDNGSHWVHIGGVSNGRGLSFNSVGDLFLASWGGGVWRLLQGDTAWTNITGSLYPYVDCLFIGSNDYIYAAKSRSTDNGNTWTAMTIPGNNISSYAENSYGHLFCGTYNFGSGVWRSTDYGDTWEQMNDGLTIMDIRSVAVDSNDYLYAGTNGESVFKTTTSTLTSLADHKRMPTVFQLQQNYPNPFNPMTTIAFELPKSSKVTIKVYNLLGEEVATLLSTSMLSGSHSVEWNASNFASGVYLYRLQSDGHVETRKMLLIR